jgi:3-hydroxybutyryl-CoA dehydrogenase
MPELPAASDMPAGVAGLGLMGKSISACLLAAGHPVVGVETSVSQRASAKRKIATLLSKMKTENLLHGPVEEAIARFRSTTDLAEFAEAQIVIESISENGLHKKELLSRVEAAVDRTVPIGCNTSAIPISILQQGAKFPKRILGIHWAEPAHTTRFLEVICGTGTSPAVARRVLALSRRWG